MRKEGASFDLPIALGILGANGDLGNVEALDETMSVGELSLDGRIRPIRGALSIALLAREKGIKNLLLPEENTREAAVVQEISVYPIKNLRDAVALMLDLQSGKEIDAQPTRIEVSDLNAADNRYQVDFSEVRGQHQAKRALEVASAGSHNILIL